MLVGTSLVYCISDILDGTIEQNDVFAILSTNVFDVTSNIDVYDWYSSSITQYSISQNPMNKLPDYSEREVLGLFKDLVRQGIILNRSTASTYSRASLGLDHKHHWYSLCRLPDDMEPAVKDAWDFYKMVEKLCKK